MVGALLKSNSILATIASLAGLGTVGSMASAVWNGETFGGVGNFIGGVAELGEEDYYEGSTERGTTMGKFGNIAGGAMTAGFAKAMQSKDYLLTNVFGNSTKAQGFFTHGKKALLPIMAWQAWQAKNELGSIKGQPIESGADLVSNVMSMAMLGSALGGKKGMVKGSMSLLSKIKEVWAKA